LRVVHGLMMNLLFRRWAAIAATIFLVGVLAPSKINANPFDQAVRPLEIGDPMPSIVFTNQLGQRETFESMLGQTVLVGFIYTRCNDECPLITQKFGRLNALLGSGPYRLLEVTIDPAYDKVGVIAAYAKKYKVQSARWQILTGDPKQLTTFVRAAGESVIDNGHGQFIHDTRLLFVAPDGRLSDVAQIAAWDPAIVAAQLQHVAGQQSSLLARANFALTKTVAQFCGGSYQAASGIIDVIAAVLLVAIGLWIAWWLRRRLFEQGA
jgi:cytochrome oxidase Cu insertion factor (SCO1/SenC/PrrC family)